MKKTILITGATDGIGLETAKTLVVNNHNVLLHGRNAAKLADVEQTLSRLGGSGKIESYAADLSNMQDVDALAQAVSAKHNKLDVLINNAGVLKAAETRTANNLDVRFMVNTFAPYRLTQLLLPLIDSTGRVLNLSSAAQASVDVDAMAGTTQLGDMEAYAQSKLAITMWSQEMAKQDGAPIMIAVNPGSLLGTKMVKEGFGTDGKDINIGSDILCRLALDDEFKNASGQYFDNDSGRFAAPHGDAANAEKTANVLRAIDAIVKQNT